MQVFWKYQIWSESLMKFYLVHMIIIMCIFFRWKTLSKGNAGWGNDEKTRLSAPLGPLDGIRLLSSLCIIYATNFILGVISLWLLKVWINVFEHNAFVTCRSPKPLLIYYKLRLNYVEVRILNHWNNTSFLVCYWANYCYGSRCIDRLKCYCVMNHFKGIG